MELIIDEKDTIRCNECGDAEHKVIKVCELILCEYCIDLAKTLLKSVVVKND